MVLPKEGEDAHIRGFIMSKLYHMKCWVKPHGNPRRHHSLTNIKKGYPKHHRGSKFDKNLSRLAKERLIYIFPHGTEHHCCAILDHEAIHQGIQIANQYRLAEGIPAWGNEFEELLKSL